MVDSSELTAAKRLLDDAKDRGFAFERTGRSYKDEDAHWGWVDEDGAVRAEFRAGTPTLRRRTRVCPPSG